jgi:hypothetical protein
MEIHLEVIQILQICPSAACLPSWITVLYIFVSLNSLKKKFKLGKISKIFE